MININEVFIKMKLISIIIPTYNSADFLRQCLDSVINQDYSNLEIILINDGSTDNTIEITEEYRQNYSNIKTINVQHSGMAEALNIGLAASNGDLVYFLSPVDFLGNNEILTKLSALMQKDHSDVITANYFEFNNEDGTTLIHQLNPYHKTFSPQEWFKNEYHSSNFLDQCFTSIYGKLFKKSLLEMVDFNNESDCVSDGTTWKIYLLASHITYINESMYVCRINLNDSNHYNYLNEDHYSLTALEERIAILTMINFDLQDELNQYVARLNYHRNHDLQDGDYYDYLNAVNKLEIIDKYKNN